MPLVPERFVNARVARSEDADGKNPVAARIGALFEHCRFRTRARCGHSRAEAGKARAHNDDIRFERFSVRRV